jgi:hypothetical protein
MKDFEGGMLPVSRLPFRKESDPLPGLLKSSLGNQESVAGRRAALGEEKALGFGILGPNGHLQRRSKEDVP